MIFLNRSLLSVLLFLTLFQPLCGPSVASEKEEAQEASAVSAQSPYETLPVEMITYMARYLGANDLLRLRGVSCGFASAVEYEFQRRSPVKYSLNLTDCLDSTIQHPQPYTVSYSLRSCLWSMLMGSKGSVDQTRIHQLVDFSQKWHYVGHDLFEDLRDSPDIESFLKSNSCLSCLTRTEDNPDLRELQLLLHAGRFVFDINTEPIPEERSVDSLLFFARSLPSSEQKSMASHYLYKLESSFSVVQHNLKAVLLLFEFCSNQGHKEAQYDLGFLYQKEGNLPEAKKWYIRAMDQRIKEAQYSLGYLYEEEGNRPKAMKYLIRAADQGMEEAQYSLGYLYEEEGNRPKAMKYLIHAADQGHKIAQNNLGFLYEKEGNLTEAIKWYTRAADQGHKIAQFNLGSLYEEEGNLTEAMKWYTLAADQGHKEAQFNLGYLYEEEGNLPEAMKWYTRAADQGDEEAKGVLEELSKKEGS